MLAIMVVPVHTSPDNNIATHPSLLCQAGLTKLLQGGGRLLSVDTMTEGLFDFQKVQIGAIL